MGDDYLYILVSVFSGALSLLAFATTALAPNSTVVVIALSVGVALLGSSWTLGVKGHVLAGERVGVAARNGAYRVGLRLRDQPALGAYVTIGSLAILALSLIVGQATGALEPLPRHHAIGIWVLFVICTLTVVLALAVKPFDRYIEFSADRLILHFGRGHARIPWESITSIDPFVPRPANVLDRGTLNGITIATDDRADYAPGTVPARTGVSNHPLTSLTVDEDTLYNVIVALHEHPELRPLLSTPEGAVLFEGPPREVRDRMTPNQVWLPWERNITAALEAGREGPSA